MLRRPSSTDWSAVGGRNVINMWQMLTQTEPFDAYVLDDLLKRASLLGLKHLSRSPSLGFGKLSGLYGGSILSKLVVRPNSDRKEVTQFMHNFVAILLS